MSFRKLQALKSKDSIKSLKKKSHLKDYVEIRDRIRVIIYALKGQKDREIAEKLDYSIQWVKKWIARYKKGGLAGLSDGEKTGAPTKLTEDQIMILYEKILEGPPSDEILSRYRISDVQKLIKGMFDVEYSISGLHSLMERMNLSHVSPRPKHPKNDLIVMEEWKKKFKNSSINK